MIIIIIIILVMRIVCEEWSDEDCMKVDEDKRDHLSIVIPPLGQLQTFGKLRFPSESADYHYCYYTILLSLLL
ncbi:hypothetical protein N665_0002s0203 [Sinapis alba]|nr:hypothetical protein N665_0002s0203 [Sinapis alba]